MNSILITGCNRGLGLGLVKALVSLPQPPRHIFATCRDLQKAQELRAIGESNQNVYIFEIDLRNFDEYGGVVNEIGKITGESGLNCLFNNAGISHKSVKLKMTKATDLVESFTTNTVVPIMFTQACLPLIEKAAKTLSNEPMGVKRAAILNMSSVLGSVKNNTTGGMYAYRTSKAALNIATKSMSVDSSPQKILCVSIHPGWVRTDMGGAKAPLDVETATTKLVETIMSFNENHNGGFFEYDGKPLPW